MIGVTLARITRRSTVMMTNTMKRAALLAIFLASAFVAETVAVDVPVPSAEIMIAEADLILVGKATVAPDESVVMQVSKTLKGDPALTGTAVPLISTYPEWAFPFLSAIQDIKDNPFVIIASKDENSKGAVLGYGMASIWPSGAPSDVPAKDLPGCVAFIQRQLRTGSPPSGTAPSVEAKLSADTSQGETAPPFPASAMKLRLKWKALEERLAQPLEIRWIAVDTAGVAPKDHVISASRSEPGKTAGAFALSKPTSGFPPGKYRVELQQAGKIIYTEDFIIR
jgi:hypothetical protein